MQPSDKFVHVRLTNFNFQAEAVKSQIYQPEITNFKYA